MKRCMEILAMKTNGAVYILSKEFQKLLVEKFSDSYDFSRDIIDQ